MAHDKTGRPVKPEVSLLFRFKVAVRILLELRTHDFRAAGTFMHKIIPEKNHFKRLGIFVKWTLGKMFIDIPEALVTTTFAKPVSRTPYWLTEKNPLENHPWRDDPEAQIPTEVDTVVIGAGFSGASCAYHWSRNAPAERDLVVLEMDDPASGSSGRNEGAVVMGRYYTYVRDTVFRDLARTRSDLNEADRKKLADQFATVYSKAAFHSSDLIEETVKKESIDCGYYRDGWIELSDEERLDVLEESIQAGHDAGFRDRNLISPREIIELSGLRTKCQASFSKGCGGWNPVKWVWALFQIALKKPNIRLFTRTKVLKVKDAGDYYDVITARGLIRARYLINAIEGYTPLLHPQFKHRLNVVQTQAAIARGGFEGMKEHVVTTGPRAFWGRRGVGGEDFLFGSDSTIIPPHLALQNKPSRFLSKYILTEIEKFYGASKLHVTHEWSGPVGFTPDEFPLIGKIDGKRQYMIGGMCGSGSNVSFNSGRCIVDRVLGGGENADDYPPEYFSPSRVLDPQNHPWPTIQK